MPRSPPKPFTITLTPEQAAAILDPAGIGGQQDLAEAIRGQLSGSNLTVVLTDPLLGKLVRYMTMYGPGGFQSRLRKAFRRPLLDMLERKLTRSRSS
jgi:hypothetical protein